MENSNLQALADFAAFVSFLSFVLGVIVLIVFFVMAYNIGTIARVIKAMRIEQMSIVSTLRKMNGTQTIEEKAKSFDDALEAAVKREHSKI